ncbi:MAG TPA: sigma-70 family RNA polymerase sigma factor, partial [Microthrixaceae bacterium]|nr:sigma-70 family RNA polymerase sigma factor [Microthrixaceae bacterium]
AGDQGRIGDSRPLWVMEPWTLSGHVLSDASNQRTSRMTSDERLLADVVAGSHVAFEQLFDSYADFVFNVAFRRTGSRVDAEDIVGEVFVELWRQREHIEPRYGSLKPWLAGIASNLARRHWRSAHRRDRALLRLRSRSVESSEDFADQAVARLEGAQRLKLLQAALVELPADQYDVLTLSVWEQLSHQEIAEALGVAVGTVKSRLSRARSKLESLIGTDAVVRALPVDRPSEAVNEQSAAQIQGGCT